LRIELCIGGSKIKKIEEEQILNGKRRMRKKGKNTIEI
jgi:hypothetical protein